MAELDEFDSLLNSELEKFEKAIKVKFQRFKTKLEFKKSEGQVQNQLFEGRKEKPNVDEMTGQEMIQLGMQI